ncbi:MAG: S9 family peptidase [Sphingobacteriales bacterium]|nr:MAG: S9 family peptidase [Sphingobacteriales bacterium]
MPHGGPGGRNSWGYNAEVQFLANRGYVVLQVNYRGSSGYGKAFLSSGFKQLGAKINDDLEDGVHWLAKEGVIDPKRVAIYGSGFGGFIALSSVYRNPGTYAAAASNSGVLNLFSYLKSIPPFFQANLKMYYDMFGNPELDNGYMNQVSPIFQAERINIPVFIGVNTKDTRSNPGDAIQYVKQLQKQHANVTYFENSEPPFSAKRDEARQKFYTSLEHFLAANLEKK